jgi:D-alanine-D-alanine ligase
VKVALLFDGISALGKSPDLAILETVEAVEAALVDDGHEVARLPVNPDGRWVERARRGKFDLAFNLCESVDGAGAMESPVIGALELIGLPYTGSGSWTTAFCLRKHAVNALLAALGLPVPPWAVARAGAPYPASVGFPAICKPAAEDASIGVEQRSVVGSDAELTARVAAMHERWPEVLVQRFIDGREVNVGIVGDTVLPIAEIDFGAMPDGMWRIVTYRSKWETGSDEDLGAAPICPAPLADDVRERLAEHALAAWRAVGGEGYGRVDCRIDAEGRPWILEVNANPDISPDAGLARMARIAGLPYAELIRRVCERALDRPRAADQDRWAVAQRLSGVAPRAAEAETAGFVAASSIDAGATERAPRAARARRRRLEA